MELSDFFPIFHKLEKEDQELLIRTAGRRTLKKGTLVNNGTASCFGVLILCSGQLRAFLTSPEGREVTLYRLFERDICLFSAPCIINSIQFDIIISADKDTDVWVIPPETYRQLMNRSAVLANYTNELMATRFTDVMWLVEQIMWKSFDKRLADFLLEESAIENTDTLKITHEQIAGHLGTAREVVTRMLRYFQSEEMVKLTRGTIEITDSQKLTQISHT
ncbi:MAG: Crp/Fnr family transcriptional regulator [Lachnospiraceae bacterium]|jgi:CRP/FNR family transcriptional regulator